MAKTKREKERKNNTTPDRQINRQTGRETDRETDRQADRQTDRQTDRKRNSMCMNSQLVSVDSDTD